MSTHHPARGARVDSRAGSPLRASESTPTDVYERELAELIGVAHAITFAHARHALISVLRASGMVPGDEIVLSPLTCKVVPLALIALGLRLVYADIDADTLNLDPERIAPAIGPRTRAVLFQHTYGSSGGIRALAAQAAARGLLLIEDCAQCMPQPATPGAPGTWGCAAVFSNNLRKPLPSGSGGFAITNDDMLANATRQLRDVMPVPDWGSTLMLRTDMWFHRHVLRPERYWLLYDLQRRFRTAREASLDAEITREIHRSARRASAHQIRIGRRALATIAEITRHRLRCCLEYTAALGGQPGVLLPCANSSAPLFYFPVLVRDKSALLAAARRRRIEVIAWPLRTPIFGVDCEQDLSRYGYQLGTSPVAEDVARRLIGLPTDPATGSRQRAAVIHLLLAHARGNDPAGASSSRQGTRTDAG